MDHSAWIQDSCRVCGGKVGKFKVSYDCHTVSNLSKLLAIGVSVEDDRKDIHPSRFCHSCYNVCTRTVNAANKGRDYTPKLKNIQWVVHTDTECTVCEHFKREQRGRKVKVTSTGRPPNQLIKERSPPPSTT